MRFIGKKVFFGKYIYGSVNSEGVHVNEYVNKNTRCANCAMRYNCAGGCRYKNHMLTDKFRNETCRFTHKFGQRYLFDKLNTDLRQEYGKDIISLTMKPINNFFIPVGDLVDK